MGTMTVWKINFSVSLSTTITKKLSPVLAGLLMLHLPSFAEETQTLRIFVNTKNPIPPYLWLDPCTNEIQGSAVKLLEKSMSTLGIPVVVKRPKDFEPSEDKVAAFENNQYDAAFVSGNQLNNPHLLIVKPPIIEIRNAIISRGDQKISADVFFDNKKTKGLLVGSIESNSIAKELFRKGMNVTMTTDTSQLIRKIIDREYDYTIIDHYFAQTLEEYTRNKQELAIDFFPFTKRAVYFAFPAREENREIVRRVSNTLQEYKDSGYVDFILYDYLRVWVGRKGGC